VERVVTEAPCSVALACPSPVKPSVPWLYPDVDFSQDEPLEATIQWAPPTWPSHKVLICQFHYRRCQESSWSLVSAWNPFPQPVPSKVAKSEPQPQAHCVSGHRVCQHHSLKGWAGTLTGSKESCVENTAVSWASHLSSQLPGEAEIRRIEVPGRSAQKAHETPSQQKKARLGGARLSSQLRQEV
jgi:hypothetical protein